MRVVVVGDRDRHSLEDERAVSKLLLQLREKYRDDLLLVSASCDDGIGKIVKDQSRVTDDDGAFLFQFMEVVVKIHAKLDRTKLWDLYTLRDGTLIRAGEEFHIFVTGKRRSGFEKLIDEVKAVGKPLFIYAQGERIPDVLRDKQSEPLSSVAAIAQIREEE